MNVLLATSRGGGLENLLGEGIKITPHVMPGAPLKSLISRAKSVLPSYLNTSHNIHVYRQGSQTSHIRSRHTPKTHGTLRAYTLGIQLKLLTGLNSNFMHAQTQLQTWEQHQYFAP